MINVAIIMGRLSADAELKQTTTGKNIVNFTVAVDRGGKDAGTDWIDVVAWEKTAEFIAQHFHKGSMIAVVGRTQTRSYEDKDGKKRKAVEVVAERVSFCGGKESAQGESKPEEQRYKAIDIADEDLPF